MRDGSLLAHLGTPDMRVPIQYALFYPDVAGARIDELRPADMGTLDFEPVDPTRYPCFGLVLDSARAGGTAPTIAATADEAAVGAFLAGEIRFGDIAEVIAGALEALSPGPADTLSAVLTAEAEARAAALEIINSISGRSAGGSTGASSAGRISGV
jgi:1-deoxy-D-xylulose-5-phosphate reductoisomerase